MDTLSPKERSERMALVKGKNTQPELVVRRFVHRLGFRYRLHAGDLPGKPDLVFVGKRKVIFVNGCFWHRHGGCGRMPKSKLEFWKPKLEENRRRDLRNQRRLRKEGWRIQVIWECQLDDMKRVERRIVEFLNAK
jgi:DNA mismatch endonuclease, patch repair protein